MRATSEPAQTVLAAEAERWLAALPTEIRPNTLAANFPHVVNRLAALWTQAARTDAYLMELIAGSRSSRRGFPFTVAMEVVRLKEYYETHVRPVPKDIWQVAYIIERNDP